MAIQRNRPDSRKLTTYARSHAVRLPDYDYSGDADIHLTMCITGTVGVTEEPASAEMICRSVEFCSAKLRYRLYGYALMPDHLHVLLSPADSRCPLKNWLRDFKSYTTNAYMKEHNAVLWQRSGHDHVCRTAETAETVLAYIVRNPLRAQLVEQWPDWPWTKVFIEI